MKNENTHVNDPRTTILDDFSPLLGFSNHVQNMAPFASLLHLRSVHVFSSEKCKSLQRCKPLSITSLVVSLAV